VARLEKFVSAAPAGTPTWTSRSRCWPRCRRSRAACEHAPSGPTAVSAFWPPRGSSRRRSNRRRLRRRLPSSRAGRRRFVLDVVARDKKGRTVSDLRPEEIEVSRRESPWRSPASASCSESRLRSGAGAPAPRRPGGTPPPHARHLVSTPSARRGGPSPAMRPWSSRGVEAVRISVMSVFYIGNRLQLLQSSPRTGRRWRRRRPRLSVLDPRGVVPGPEATDAPTAAANTTAERAQATSDVAMAGGGAGAGPAAGRLRQRRRLSNLELRAVEMARSLERSQRGNGSCSASSALARQQQRLAGARPSSTSRGPSRSRTSWSRSTGPWSARPTGQTSASTRDARGSSPPPATRTRSGTSASRWRRAAADPVARGRAVHPRGRAGGRGAEDAITLNVQGCSARSPRARAAG